MSTRTRPTPDLSLVFHPQQDTAYQHFADGRDHPFDPGAASLGRRNAWWLAEAALLAYWPPESAVARYAAAGWDAEPIVGGTTQSYLACTNEAVMVTFRGTEPGEPGDVLDDVTFALVPWDRPGSHVHAGFKLALNRVWPRLEERLEPLAKSRTVWFAGHSLGAALAALAADRFPRTTGVCTFGGPRVGDWQFATAHSARFGPRALRFVNDADIVTHLPPPVPYKHAGTGRFIDPEGVVSSQRPPHNHFFREIIGNPRHLREVTKGLHDGRMHEAPDFLLDHMPRAYAVDLWNDYVRHGN